MEYRTRITWSAGGSVLVHLSLILLVAWRLGDVAHTFAPHLAPLVLRLQAPEPIKRLVDSVMPATEPVRDTDRIAVQDSAAGDLSTTTGDAGAPDLRASILTQRAQSPDSATPWGGIWRPG